MAFYQFQRNQLIPSTIDEIWQFISAPSNLKKITPDYMGFDITSKDVPDKMYAGMVISYSVRPLLNIKTTWVTEISQVNKNKYFVDEQRIGPYSLWHHQHFIESVKDGVLMTDIVSYKPPFGIIGAIANTLIIRKKLNEIFDYRTKAIEKKFGIYNS